MDGDESTAVATATRAERASKVVEVGLRICSGLLLVCEVLPVVGGVCGVAREILKDVRELKDKADDVVNAGCRVVDVLKLLELFSENANKTLEAKARADVEERIGELEQLLEAVRDQVRAFREEGFLMKMIMTWSRVKTLSKLDGKIDRAMQSMRDAYNLARDNRIFELFGTMEYKLEAAIVASIRARAEGASESLEEAGTSVAKDEKAILGIAARGGVPNVVLELEITKFPEDFRRRFRALGTNVDVIRRLCEEMKQANEQRFEITLDLLKDIIDKIGDSALMLPTSQPSVTQGPGDLLKVFEIVMSERAEQESKAELQTFLTNRGKEIEKNKLTSVEFFGLRTKRPCTPLHVACALGKIGLVKVLAIKGFDVNAADEPNRLPFHYAARHGHHEIVKWIIRVHRNDRFQPGSTKKSLADLLKAEDTDGRTAFELAVLAGHVQVIAAFEAEGLETSLASISGPLSSSLLQNAAKPSE